MDGESLLVNIDKFSKWVGNIVCWILIPLIFAMTYEVFARKLFHSPTIWAYDISRFLYGALFMLGCRLCSYQEGFILELIFYTEILKPKLKEKLIFGYIYYFIFQV